jgi:DNA-directed RNA polymerase subunit RPC12/RpoP
MIPPLPTNCLRCKKTLETIEQQKRKICPKCVLDDEVKRLEKLKVPQESVFSEDTERVWAMLRSNDGQFTLCKKVGPYNIRCSLNESHKGHCAGYFIWCSK